MPGSTANEPQTGGWYEVIRAQATFEQALKGFSEDLGEMRGAIGQLLSELKVMRGEDSNLRADYASRCVMLESVKMKTDKLTERIVTVEKVVPVVRIITWVGAALGASIIALIWALITGQAQVVFGGR